MKPKDKPMKNKNPNLQSILEHLSEETIHPDKIDLWPAVQADLVASKPSFPHKEFAMKKRFVFTALAAGLVLAVVAVFSARNVTRVSAQEILKHASVAQAVNPAEGISHIKTENYFNLEALPENQGTRTILDSYGDLQSGSYRTVTFDSETGKVLDASAYDGANTYSRDYSEPTNSGDALTIYRTPQGKLADLRPAGEAGGVSEKDIFDQMRNDPNVKFVGEETWGDGRKVYLLQSQQQMKVMAKNGLERPLGLVMVYFDVETYKQLGYRMTMEKDGREILLGSQKILADEILPAGTSIAWDLSDLQGITIVDDPKRIHGDLLPEVISAQELATQTKSAYLLKSVPEGYSLEISEPQIKPDSNEPYIYIASYRTEANDYFVIQSGVGRPTAAVEANCSIVSGEKSCSTEQPSTANDGIDETYTTASGLVLHFEKDFADPSGKQYTSAFVKAPDGVSFLITSTLPRKTVKQWAEDLVVAK
jgi:hypothetical protein